MKTRPTVELYDLMSDPHELRNLADDPQLKSVRARLKDQLAFYNTKLANRFGPDRRYFDVADRVTGEQIRRSQFPTLRPGSTGPAFSLPDSPKIPFPKSEGKKTKPIKN